jgi:hypothetical protein
MHNETNPISRRRLISCAAATTSLLASAVALAGQGEFVALPGLGSDSAVNPNGCYVNATTATPRSASARTDKS